MEPTCLRSTGEYALLAFMAKLLSEVMGTSNKFRSFARIEILLLGGGGGEKFTQKPDISVRLNAELMLISILQIQLQVEILLHTWAG